MWIFPGVYHLFATQLQICNCVAFYCPHFQQEVFMQTDNKMGTASINKLILTMSLPPLFSMFLQYSYNLIDSAFVAQLSENALTAVSLSFPLTTIMNATSIWIGVGINVLIAGSLGKKEQMKANSIASTGLLLSFMLGLILNLAVLATSRIYFQAFTSNDQSKIVLLVPIRMVTA